MRITTITMALLVPAVLSAAAAQPQDAPRFRNGRVETLAAPASLESWLGRQRGSDEAWAGYEVDRIAGRHHPSCEVVAHLDGDRHFETRDEDEAAEGSLLVFFRAGGGRVEDVRTFGSGCEIDLGGRTVELWSAVPVEDGLDWLSALVRPDTRENVAKRAIHAIALHAGDEAYRRLARFAADASAPWPVRKQAVFWMGAARGEEAVADLSRMLEAARESGMAKQLVFALHVSRSERATQALIDAAKAHPSSEAREQAIFWLAQDAGKLAARTIADAVRNDPELDVKKKAVFALSQLPPEEGVPLLIEVAESHPHPAIRKKAFFWLGQSGERSALAFIERVLLEGR